MQEQKKKILFIGNRYITETLSEELADYCEDFPDHKNAAEEISENLYPLPLEAQSHFIDENQDIKTVVLVYSGSDPESFEKIRIFLRNEKERVRSPTLSYVVVGIISPSLPKLVHNTNQLYFYDDFDENVKSCELSLADAKGVDQINQAITQKPTPSPEELKRRQVFPLEIRNLLRKTIVCLKDSDQKRTDKELALSKLWGELQKIGYTTFYIDCPLSGQAKKLYTLARGLLDDNEAQPNGNTYKLLMPSINNTSDLYGQDLPPPPQTPEEEHLILTDPDEKHRQLIRISDITQDMKSNNLSIPRNPSTKKIFNDNEIQQLQNKAPELYEKIQREKELSEKGWLSRQTLDVLIFVLNITLSKSSSPDETYHSRYDAAVAQKPGLKDFYIKEEKIAKVDRTLAAAFLFFFAYLETLPTKEERDAFMLLRNNEDQNLFEELSAVYFDRCISTASQHLASFVWHALRPEERKKLSRNFKRNPNVEKNGKPLHHQVKTEVTAQNGASLVDEKKSEPHKNLSSPDNSVAVIPPQIPIGPDTIKPNTAVRKSWKYYMRLAVAFLLFPFAATKFILEASFRLFVPKLSKNWGGEILQGGLNMAIWVTIALFAFPLLGWTVDPVSFFKLSIPILEVTFAVGVLLYHIVDANLTDRPKNIPSPLASHHPPVSGNIYDDSRLTTLPAGPAAVHIPKPDLTPRKPWYESISCFACFRSPAVPTDSPAVGSQISEELRQ